MVPAADGHSGVVRRTLDIYRNAQEKGMDFVTISDHNCIRGALEIAHLPGTFISNEVTTYFPENGCKVHMLVTGINEEQFRMIQELRAESTACTNIWRARTSSVRWLIAYLRVNGRLTIEQFERLVLLFPRFELINGARDRRAADLLQAILGNLTPEMIRAMSDRQGIEPLGPHPGRSGLRAAATTTAGPTSAAAFTRTPLAAPWTSAWASSAAATTPPTAIAAAAC